MQLVIKRIYILVVFLLTASSVNAGLFGNTDTSNPRPVEEVFILSTELLEENKLLLRWDILDDYYLYDNRMKFTLDTGESAPEVSRSKTKPKDDPLFGKVEVYYYSSEIVLDLSRFSDRQTVAIKIEYQGCWDGGVCYPPISETRQFSLINSTANQSQSPAVIESVSVDQFAKIQPIEGSASDQDYFSSLLAGGNLAWIMAVFFVAGLALSLTPCVLPMIPILSGIIIGQGKDVTKRRAFTLSLVYVLAVAATYTVAGVLAGIFGENLQALLQATWIIVVFSVIFVLLALSMFGLYELQLPSWLQTKLAAVSNNQRSGNYVGVAIMGALSALIVGPCMAAPLAGALIYIAQSADPVLGGAALFALSMGMGVPLLLVGYSAGHLLPRVGVWMSTVKAAFGVLLILMAIYMLDRVVSFQTTLLLTTITIIFSAVFMGALTPLSLDSKQPAKFLKGFSLITLVYGLSLLIGVFIGNASFSQPLQGLVQNRVLQLGNQNKFIKVTSLAQMAPILLASKAEGIPVMLDFYADWCVSCAELEEMFAEQEVAAQLAKMRLIKVDLTDFNQDARALLEKYQVLGPPALVFYNSRGQLESGMKVIGLVPAKRFLAHIKPLLTP